MRNAFLFGCIFIFLPGCPATSQGGGSNSNVDTLVGVETSLNGDSEQVQPQGGLAINEVVTSPAGEGTDWFEVVVIGTEAVDLGEFTIVDDNANHERAPIGTGLLNPGEFYMVKAISADDTSDTPSVPFKLGSDALGQNEWRAQSGMFSRKILSSLLIYGKDAWWNCYRELALRLEQTRHLLGARHVFNGHKNQNYPSAGRAAPHPARDNQCQPCGPETGRGTGTCG